MISLLQLLASVFALLLCSSESANEVGFTIQNTVHHDSQCFTQGLEFFEGMLIESCGLTGRSSVRKVDPKTGKVVVETKLPAEIFAEGLTVVHGMIYMLSWKNKKMFVLRADTLELLFATSFTTYNGEGWGIAHDDQGNLIASDGSDRLTFLSTPKNAADGAKNQRTIQVKDLRTGASQTQINELEFVGGYLYANIWYHDFIIKIDPQTGNIVERIDLKNLYPQPRAPTADCLNGIAYNATGNSLVLTGKLWPSMYQVVLQEHISIIRPTTRVPPVPPL